MLYGTAIGVDPDIWEPINENAGIWSINTDDLPWTINRLYDGNNTIISDGYIYHPNGCIINNGIIYLVEFRTDGERNMDSGGAFGMYNIKSGIFTYNLNILNTQGDGIIYSSPYFFVTSWINGQLLAYNPEKENSSFSVILSGLATGDGSNGAQDLCLGPNNVLAIPNQVRKTIYFVQFDIGDHNESKAAATNICIQSIIIILLLLL